MLEHIRDQIQQRLDEITVEADRLRRALAHLGESRQPARKIPARKGRAAAATRKPAAKPSTPAPARRRRVASARSTGRAASGGTKASVLAALAGGEALTAGDLAKKTGLGRGSVSTTLSKLAKSGEVQKADRGYRLAKTT